MPTISVDFDGVIHSYASGWQGYVPTDPPTKGAREFVEWLLNEGYEVDICSARANHPEGLAGIQAWLVEHDFNPRLRVTATKDAALLYVDDRGYRFDGDFKLLMSFISYGHHHKVWHQQ